MTLDPQVKRVHYYHADANALGGQISRPITQIVPVQVPISLSPVGGYASADVGPFRLGTILSFTAAHTQVAGSTAATGSYSTMVTSVVEGLNILNIVTADRLVAHLSIEHPAQGYVPKVSFVGTQFQNVKIGGQDLAVQVNLDVCKQGDGVAFPNVPLITDKDFLARVTSQRSDLLKQGGNAQWLTDRYPANIPQDSDSILCSVVKGISGDVPATLAGNTFTISDFGRGFFGELLVESSAFRLIMLRLELGCGTEGSVAIAAASGNGSTDP